MIAGKTASLVARLTQSSMMPLMGFLMVSANGLSSISPSGWCRIGRTSTLLRLVKVALYAACNKGI